LSRIIEVKAVKFSAICAQGKFPVTVATTVIFIHIKLFTTGITGFDLFCLFFNLGIRIFRGFSGGKSVLFDDFFISYFNTTKIYFIILNGLESLIKGVNIYYYRFISL